MRSAERAIPCGTANSSRSSGTGLLEARGGGSLVIAGDPPGAGVVLLGCAVRRSDGGVCHRPGAWLHVAACVRVAAAG
jgi:hypothetical protein